MRPHLGPGGSRSHAKCFRLDRGGAKAAGITVSPQTVSQIKGGPTIEAGPALTSKRLVRCVRRFVHTILDGILGVALELLGIALSFLSGAFRLHLIRSDGLADALFDLPGSLIGDSGSLVRIPTHVLSFHASWIRATNKALARTFRGYPGIDASAHAAQLEGGPTEAASPVATSGGLLERCGLTDGY